MSINIKPTDDHLLVLQADEETQKGGIILATTGIKPNRGKVIEIGDKVSVVKKGDQIVFGKFIGESVTVEKDTYLIMRETEIAGIIIDK